ncbi:hypothetical protein Ahy_B01g054800 isoform A [Arachis hypogaea]|uniref:Uncharacterized protein n=1 Tax=Arachis hypogaea TaxID=3818 RepID=A0A445AUE1_ARAHY|nr:hypothetical protein Ahy_B01g054800 isoform A [Arachis hypogaea]
MYNIQQEIGEKCLITWQLSIARKVIDINNEVPFLVIGISNHINVEEVKPQSLPQPPSQLAHQPLRRHFNTIPFLLLLTEWHRPLQILNLFLRYIRQRLPPHASHVPPRNVDLENRATVVHELLHHHRTKHRLCELALPSAAKGFAITGNRRFTESSPSMAVLSSFATACLGTETETTSFWRESLGTESSIAIYCVGWVDDWDGGVVKGEVAELLGPLRGVEFVDDGVEWELLVYGCGEVDWYELNGVIFGMVNQGVLEEALDFLGFEGEPYSIPAGTLTTYFRHVPAEGGDTKLQMIVSLLPRGTVASLLYTEYS